MKEKVTGKISIWVIITGFILITGFPLFIMASISLQTMAEVYSSKIVLLPVKPMFENYIKAMNNGNWSRYITNSVYITTVIIAISLLINSMTGYVFARIRFKGAKVLFILLLAGMMVPPQATMIPLFLMIKNIPLAGGNNIFGAGGSGLINTYTGLMLPFIAGSFGVFLCRQYYRTFPKSLDEAAIIDGCGRFGIYLHIYLPLSKPVIASLAILKITGTWNEYTWPLLMTNTDAMKTVQIALTMFRDESGTQWNLLMAATLVSSSIIYLLFILLQKYFVAGITESGLKE